MAQRWRWCASDRTVRRDVRAIGLSSARSTRNGRRAHAYLFFGETRAFQSFGLYFDAFGDYCDLLGWADGFRTVHPSAGLVFWQTAFDSACAASARVGDFKTRHLELPWQHQHSRGTNGRLCRTLHRCQSCVGAKPTV